LRRSFFDTSLDTAFVGRQPLPGIAFASGRDRSSDGEEGDVTTTKTAFFDQYLAAWNAHDPAGVARHMADDAIYEDVALGRVLHGPSEIAGFVEEATRASSDFRFEEVSLFTAGSNYANEWIMTGTNDRDVQGVPATGRSFRVRGASVGKLDASGRIVHNRDYYNLAEMFAQLGIQPVAPPRPA
jgi:steroid delta-isomerase-like uncharacterized protein